MRKIFFSFLSVMTLLIFAYLLRESKNLLPTDSYAYWIDGAVRELGRWRRSYCYINDSAIFRIFGKVKTDSMPIGSMDPCGNCGDGGDRTVTLMTRIFTPGKRKPAPN
jgi:hypothetical protein